MWEYSLNFEFLDGKLLTIKTTSEAGKRIYDNGLSVNTALNGGMLIVHSDEGTYTVNLGNVTYAHTTKEYVS